MRATVSGHPGSGTSTLVRGICASRGWTHLNGGDIFRAEAARRGIALEAFSELCKADPAVDHDLDQQLQAAMAAAGGPEVVESRLAGWWAHRLELDCARIWVEVSPEERANRVVSREGGTLDEQLEKGRLRMASDAVRYQELYGIDLADMTPYDHIIHADALDIDGVLNAALQHLEERA